MTVTLPPEVLLAALREAMDRCSWCGEPRFIRDLCSICARDQWGD